MITVTIKLINKIIYAYSKQKHVSFKDAIYRNISESSTIQNPKIGKTIFDIEFNNINTAFEIRTLCFNIHSISEEKFIKDYCKLKLRLIKS